MEINFHNIPVFVINLPQRPERLIRCKQELNKLFGYNKDVILMNGVIDQEPMLGIAKAHLKCIQFAKKYKMDYIFIVEDDLFVFDNATQYAEQAFLNAPDDFDILYGCCYSGDPIAHSQYWDKQTQTHSGNMFYLVPAKMYDTLINEYDYNSHFDCFMSKYKLYVANKFFVKQYNNEYSDNVNRIVDYDQNLSKYKTL